jgi:imidazolonepropionase-like amidohydrolase
VLRGEILVQVHCYKADELRQMIDIADELGFAIRSFHHALEAYKVRDLLVGRDIAISTWADWWGFKMEAFDGIPENAALFAEAGGRAVIHSDSDLGVQRLHLEASKAFYAGRAAGIDVGEDQALRWVTANPAWVLGIDGVTGTLEVGKRADAVLWSAHPFSVYARADAVYQGGELIYDRAAGLRPSDFELGNSALGVPEVTAAGAARNGAGAGAADRSGAPTRVPTSGPTVAITGATVHVAPGRTLTDATVLLRGARITAVGRDLAIPADARRIDGRGKVVTAGLIETHATIGLMEVEMVASTVEGRFADAADDDADTVHAAYRVVDGYNPASVAVAIARTGGVTSIVAIPRGGLVAGTSAWLTLAEAARTEAVTVRARLAMHVSLGEAALGSADGSRGVALLRLRELFADAAFFAKNRRAHERNQTRSVAATRLDLEALQPALRGAMPVVVRVNRASDIDAAVRLGRELGLRVVVSGGAEARRIADELARARVPVILDPTRNLPQSFDTIHVRDDAAARLVVAGVPIAISTLGTMVHGDLAQGRTLRQLAGMAVARGLAWDAALAAVTTGPAAIFGVTDRGTVTAGSVADVVVWSGDPFELATRAEHVFIGGVEQSLRTRQTELRDRYRRVPLRRP